MKPEKKKAKPVVVEAKVRRSKERTKSDKPKRGAWNKYGGRMSSVKVEDDRQVRANFKWHRKTDTVDGDTYCARRRSPPGYFRGAVTNARAAAAYRYLRDRQLLKHA